MFFGGIVFLSCNPEQKAISGPLEIPGSLFNYYAEGEGIPCVTYTGGESIGQRLYPDKIRERFIIISADPEDIPNEIVSDITLEDVVDDIEKMRLAMDIEKIAVMGHSMFGTLPLEYALKYPDHVSFLITTGSVPYADDKYFTEQQKYWENEASAERKNVIAANNEKLQSENLESYSESDMFKKRYMANIPLRFFDPHFDMTEIWEGIELNTPFLNHYWGKLIVGHDNSDNYKKIKAPVIVITGKYDFGAPYYLWKEFEESISDFTLVAYENAGHNPMLEIPEEFTNTLLEWIENKR